MRIDPVIDSVRDADCKPERNFADDQNLKASSGILVP